MTIAESQRSGREVWGRILVGISVAGTVLTVVAVLVLGVALYGFMSDFGGSPAPWWYWPMVLGFAAAGVVGLVVTRIAPWLAYLLRLVAWIPWLSVGLGHPWLLALAAIVGAAHVSLLLATWRWTRSLAVRVVVGLTVSVLLALLAMPLERDLSCENVGDPPETCEAWYRSVIGWGVFEEDERHLGGWGVAVVLAGVLVAIPVPPRD